MHSLRIGVNLGIATGLKRVLKFSRLPRRIRFGWETEPTGSGGRIRFGWETEPTGPGVHVVSGKLKIHQNSLDFDYTLAYNTLAYNILNRTLGEKIYVL